MSKKIVFAYVTAPDSKVAVRIGRAVVEAKLAACANILPKMTSVYRWKGEIENANESVLILKTTPARIPRLKTLIKKIHPYENPCLVVLPITDGLTPYLNWIANT